LFTGDAGKTALHAAADYAAGIGVPLTGLNFLDVPHHGSRRNLSTSVLSRINGTTAFISASPGSSKHPSKKVVNALKKSGARVFKTNGGTIRHHHNAPNRGWSGLQEEPFHDLVEA
jgi:beta-lactamase superfamily II metal-dependent hydrolase